MNSKTSLSVACVGSLVATLLAGCATSASKSVTAAATADSQLAASPAGAAAAKLQKNLSAAEVRAALGVPASVKPIVVGEAKGENWSYPFTASVATHMVPVGTKDLPAVNPITGQSITRPEIIYQNQDTQIVDTLHLLLFDGRLIEWKIVRDEKKQFQ